MVVWPQGRFDRMLQANRTERNAILTSILGLEEIASTRDVVTELRNEWQPKAAGWSAERGHYPDDLAAARTDATTARDTAVARAIALTAAVETVDESEAAVAALADVSRQLDATTDPVVDPNTAVELGNLLEQWDELVETHQVQAKVVAALDHDLHELDRLVLETLAGFATRDDLIEAEVALSHTTDGLVEALDTAATAATALDDLTGNPPSGEVPDNIVAAERDADRRRSELDAARRQADTDLVEARRSWPNSARPVLSSPTPVRSASFA